MKQFYLWALPLLLTCQQVDVVEVNHVYCETTGEEVLHQVIWWDWNEKLSRYDVVAWRYLRQAGRPRQQHGYWVSQWWDKKKLRTVKARLTRETWTFYDVEVYERKLLRCSQRRGIK